MAFIPETVYGETPLVGDFKTARLTSEALSGSVETTESQQIRTDRMSSGQIVTGSTVGGDLNFELAKEPALDDFLSSAMFNNWSTLGLFTVNLTIDADLKTITRAAGSFVTDGIVVGDFVTLGGFVAAANNVQVMVAEVVSPTVIRYVGPMSMVDAVGTGTTYKRADKLTIGTMKKSFSMEKTFLDLTDKAIIYKGMIVDTLSLNVAYGELINGTMGFLGNGYYTVATESEFITDGRTIVPAATSNTLNGSIDMPFLASSAVGELDESGLDIQSVELSLTNNDTAQNVIGRIAPVDYSAGTARIEVTINAYLKDAAWPILAKKLTQEPFGIGFQVKNLNGWYAFYLPQVQVAFDDPASGGQDQEISLEMTGQAKVGALGESALVIYRSV